MLKIALSLLFISYWNLTIFGQNAHETLQADSLQIGENSRSFLYHKSTNLSRNPALIFVLHGSNGSGKLISQFSENWFSRLAEEKGNTVVVYPNGYKKHWNECRKEANFEANLLNIDDNSFFEKMIEYFIKNHHINPKQVFVVGHSNGGHEVFKLAKEKPNLFKKFVAISANLPTPSNDDCYEIKKPVSIMVINGTGDKVNPYQGGEVILGGDIKRGNVISTDATMQYWANLAHEDFSKATRFDFPDTDKEDGTTATEFTLKNKKTDIRLIKVENGGHVLSVPVKTSPPAMVGKSSRDINMAQIAFDFFFGK